MSERIVQAACVAGIAAVAAFLIAQARWERRMLRKLKREGSL